MTTLASALSAVTESDRIEDTLLARDYTIRTLVAETNGINGYSTFSHDGAAYKPDSGKMFIALILRRLQKGASAADFRIGTSTAATTYPNQAGAPAGFAEVFHIPALSSNTARAQQVLMMLRGQENVYLTCYQAMGASTAFMASLVGIELTAPSV